VSATTCHGTAASNHPDHHVIKADRLADADLAGLAQFGDAIHRHRAAGDDELAGTAAVAEAGELQQLVEFDMLVGRVEFENE
jgi:hypothetical protein